MPAGAGQAKWTGRWIGINRCSSRRTQKRRHATSSWVAAWRASGDGGDDVIGIGEVEEQVPAEGGKTHCGRPHEARSLFCKIVKSQTQVHDIFFLPPPWANLFWQTRQNCLRNFPNPGTTRHEHHPGAVFFRFSFFFVFRNSLNIIISYYNITGIPFMVMFTTAAAAVLGTCLCSYILFSKSSLRVRPILKSRALESTRKGIPAVHTR